MTRSRLVLGTVQLGMPYGVRAGAQPSQDEAFRILDEAYERGVNTFDTASSYGSAEDVLGQWMTRRGNQSEIFVITKMRHGALGEDPRASAADIADRELMVSLSRLKLEHVDGYLLHDPALLRRENMVDALLKLKERGLTAHVGVSVYDESDALASAESRLDYIQVPYNVLDQRLHRTEFFSLARESGKTIFSRSALLQGLLTMDIADVPQHLSVARPFLERFHAIAKKADRSPLAAAFQYAYIRSPADNIVFGVDSREQLREILALAKEAKDEPWMAEIQKTFVDVPREVVDPRLWGRPSI